MNHLHPSVSIRPSITHSTIIFPRRLDNLQQQNNNNIQPPPSTHTLNYSSFGQTTTYNCWTPQTPTHHGVVLLLTAKRYEWGRGTCCRKRQLIEKEFLKRVSGAKCIRIIYYTHLDSIYHSDSSSSSYYYYFIIITSAAATFYYL